MSKEGEPDKVRVYLRVKPLSENEHEIIEIEDNQTVTVNLQRSTQANGPR